MKNLRDATDDPALTTEAEADASTRAKVGQSILQHGPSTAAQLANRLGLTAAAVRRHLSVLLELGHLTSREQRVYGQRGRGRPARVFVLTDAGRAEFYQAYDRLAIEALDHLQQVAGDEGIRRFAEQVAGRIETRFVAIRTEYDQPLEALVRALTDEGFVATLKPAASGQQLCQYHCPVAHVAERFPQLCEAETRAFARLLDSHVQRLATIAHGDGVCTTHVPRPVTPADHQPHRRKGSR